MKKIRNLFGIVLLAFVLVVSLSACKAKKVKVGILQYVTHTALGAATEGFKSGLLSKLPNVEFEVLNPEADASALELDANKLVRECDLVIRIATPAAVALMNARDNNNLTIPVFFTAVTDPVDAGLVKKDGTSNNVFGTSDDNDVEGQIQMIQKVISNIDEFTVLYTASETNSQVQAERAKKEAEKQKLTCNIETISESSELSATLTKIANSGVKALYIPTDNLMASSMSAISESMTSAHILVVCGEEGMVLNGGSISNSISYKELGIATGEMAAKVLQGEKLKKTAFYPADLGNVTTIAINESNIKAIGLNLSEVKKALGVA